MDGIHDDAGQGQGVPGDIVSLLPQLNRLEQLLKPLVSSPSNASSDVNNNHVNLHVHSDADNSRKLWIAATCCVVMVVLTIVMSIIGSMAYYSLHSDVQREQDYLNNIYQVAPQLKSKGSP